MGGSVAERNRLDFGARRRDPKRERPDRLGRKFLHPGPVSDELLDELTSTEVLPAHEERPYLMFLDRRRFCRPVSDSSRRESRDTNLPIRREPEVRCR